MRFFCYTVAFLLCISTAHAQKMDGYWKGTLTMTGGCFPVNYIELQIRTEGSSLVGDSYHYMDIDNYVKKNMWGSYDPKTKTVELQEGAVTTFKIPSHCSVCIKNYRLTWSKEDNRETLTGYWTGHIRGTENTCTPGTLTLYRIQESAFKAVPELAVDTGSIRLDFYDNGEIDGDSITVIANGNVLLSHQKLTAKPVTVFVPINANTSFQEVEMRAENLGSIPPNTALLIVTAGKKRYQLFLTSTENKAARVRFVYDPKKESTF